jgi:hypothetical protein
MEGLPDFDKRLEDIRAECSLRCQGSEYSATTEKRLIIGSELGRKVRDNLVGESLLVAHPF